VITGADNTYDGEHMRLGLSALAVSVMMPTGCVATEAQRHAQEIGQTAQTAMAQMRTCLSIIEANPRYDRIYQKLAVATSKEPERTPSAAQLSDSEIVSDDDKSLGFEWYAEDQNCGVPAIEALGKIDPEFQIYFADRLAELTDVLNDIAANSQTYGQINAKIATVRQHNRAAATEFVNVLKAKLSEQHQQELAERAEDTEELVSALGTIALAVATRGRASITRLGSHQSALARAQAAHARLYPRYVIVHRVRVIHCDGIGRTLRCALRDGENNGS
jgi:hypothetical protein